MSLHKESIFSKVSRHLWIVGAAAGVLVAGLSVAAPGFLGDMVMNGMNLDPEVSGEFISTNDELGKWSFAPDSCRSGERLGFHGVVLHARGDDQHAVRVARDPASGETVVSTRVPGTDKAAVFSGCKVASELHRTNTSVNEVWGMEGNVEINCPEDGFSGHANFGNCF